MTSSTIRAFTCLIILTAVLLLFGCRDTEPEQQTALTAEMPLHLEDHLDVANIEGSEVPEDLPEPVEWRFDEPQPDWKVVDPCKFKIDSKPPEVVRTEDALRIVLTKANSVTRRSGRRRRRGSVYVDLPDWQYGDWAYVVVRARASRGINSLWLGFNLRDEPNQAAFEVGAGYIGLIHDGSVQTYLLRADWLPYGQQWKGGPWRQLGLCVEGPFKNPEEAKPDSPTTLDILSVSVIPKAAVYADAAVGVRTEVRGQAHRRTLYAHTPARLEYHVRLPEAARLDVGLGVLREDVPVTFRVIARSEGGTAETLLEETHTDKLQWAQRSVDLSRLAGKTVTLTLEAVAERPGTIALWAAPTLSRSRRTQKPNVIFYIIDGAAADHMSLFGYNRRTTPNLERLAAEGAVFENVYSNSTWTRISTPSFMTSLHHSVLGGYKSDTDPLPDQAVTMAQHMHRAGYQTAVFTTNAYAGIISGLDRGVDVLREADVELNMESSKELHEDFWSWREKYPGEPYWVHFQTTDVHKPWRPAAPFAGLFISPERRKTYYEWVKRLPKARGRQWTLEEFEEAGIDRRAFDSVQRGLYDECMAYQDHQIGRLVRRLKATGQWDRTLLIVAADHGCAAAGLRLLDPLPPPWVPMLRASETRIPLVIVWPDRIPPGQRFTEPVSMIDMMPTIFDLLGLPMPEVMQGQSLTPLLMGEQGWEPRPVILDEFYGDSDTGEFSGLIEVIDGRWGASLEINLKPEDEDSDGPSRRRPVPLLLYDVWNDPECLRSLHKEHPDLVEKYTRFLKAQFEAHKALAQQFTRSEDSHSPLTPEQLRTLRSLGYIE